MTKSLSTVGRHISLKNFHQFCDNCNIPSCNFYLKEAEMKIAMFAHFKDYHGNHKNFKSLYGFGWRCLKIRDVCMDFEPYFKVHNLVNVHPKNIKLGQMTNLNMIFHVVVSDYRLPKIWNSPQFPVQFRNGQLESCFQLFEAIFRLVTYLVPFLSVLRNELVTLYLY